MAGFAHETIASGLGSGFFASQHSGKAIGRVTLGAASFDFVGGLFVSVQVPVAPGSGSTVEVTSVFASQLGHVGLGLQFGSSVQVFSRVIEQLDDVLAAVSKRTRVLEGNLVVVGSLQQASSPISIANVLPVFLEDL